ncbi:hypothetical protein [Tabrizicola sp.]|uniref:hypothetical protein n=1 Tax=Tabrizicola sp. TaxID=2005166 RepID=UPI003F3355AD
MQALISKRNDICMVSIDESGVSADFISAAAGLVTVLRNQLLESKKLVTDFEVAVSALGFFSVIGDKAAFLDFLPLSLDLCDTDGVRLYRVASHFHTFWLLLKYSSTPLEKDVLILELTKRFGDEYVSALMAKMAARNMAWVSEL